MVNIGTSAELKLTDGSKTAVVGGGPAGSFFSYFLLELAGQLDLDLQVDIFEPRDFSLAGARGCNHCAGIISESLIQMLATEGINLPPVVVQRGIERYVLHTPRASAEIKTALAEKRIAAVFRGGGPRDQATGSLTGFDAHLLKLAADKGARHRPAKVKEVAWDGGRPQVKTTAGDAEEYDLLVVAAGLNLTTLKSLEALGLKYRPPTAVRSHIREFYLGSERVAAYLGDAVHIFLLNVPRLEFMAIVPKGDYATLVVVGEDIDKELVENLLAAPQVQACLPSDLDLQGACRCSPMTYLRAATEPFADRLVFIGDSGTSRLYKDGIGAAYRTAKAAATTAVLQGVAADDFRRHYWRICRLIEGDNGVGRVVFWVNRQIKKSRRALGGIMRMVEREQKDLSRPQRMSGVMWDTFTGSAPYRDIFRRTLHPFFLVRYLSDIGREAWPLKRGPLDKGA